MRPFNSKITVLLYGLLLAAALDNCRTKDVGGITPFLYNTHDRRGKLPEITPTTPATVSVTAASVASSTLITAITRDLSSITSTGTIPASVQQAVADVSKAVSAAQAAELVATFTPAVVSSLSAEGTLPAELKTSTDAIASNPALQAYLSKFIFPTVNGKAVGGRIRAQAVDKVVAVVVTAKAITDDACVNAANAAYMEIISGYDSDRARQTATILTINVTAITAANAEIAPCKNGLPAKYNPLRTSATQALTSGLTNLETARTIVGEPTYNLLKVLYLVSYTHTMMGLTVLQNTESVACDSVASAKRTAAATAQDTDLNKINSNYNTEVNRINAALKAAISACDNQGGGRLSAD